MLLSPDTGAVLASASMTTDPRLAEKRAIHARVCANLRADLETLQRSHADALQGITHEDARQEGDKDMRSTEASYVARGQARRVTELQDELAALTALELRLFGPGAPVALGALVTVELESGEASYFVAPAGAGIELAEGARRIRVVTPRSPLGRALLGRSVADDVSWSTPQGEIEGKITAVH